MVFKKFSSTDATQHKTVVILDVIFFSAYYWIQLTEHKQTFIAVQTTHRTRTTSTYCHRIDLKVRSIRTIDALLAALLFHVNIYVGLRRMQESPKKNM